MVKEYKKIYMNIVLGLISIVLFSFLFSSCSSNDDSVKFEETHQYTLYIEKYTEPNLKIETGLSSYFIPFSYDSYNFYSEKTFKSLDGIQEWLDNNSNVEILSIIGPVVKNKLQGIEIIFRESEKEHDYYVYLSETNINYEGYVASYKFSAYTGGGDYHSGACIIIVEKNKIFEDDSIIENNTDVA